MYPAGMQPVGFGPMPRTGLTGMYLSCNQTDPKTFLTTRPFSVGKSNMTSSYINFTSKHYFIEIKSHMVNFRSFTYFHFRVNLDLNDKIAFSGQIGHLQAEFLH